MAKILARKAAARIARERLGIATNARGSVDLRVSALRAALAAAFEAGWMSAHAAERLTLRPGDIVVLSRPGRPGRQAGDE